MSALKQLAAPFAHTGIRFMPTGGVSAHNAAEYLALATVAAVGGSWVSPRALVRRTTSTRSQNSPLRPSQPSRSNQMTAQEQYPTYTATTLVPASRPHVLLHRSEHGWVVESAQVFPKSADEFDLGDVDFVGIDMPLHAAEDYRRVVQFFRDDDLSIGALVTTHKLDLYQAAADLFDYSDPLTILMDEISCISKRDGQLRAHAKDPLTAGFALDAFLTPGSWAGRSAFVMGAGGSAIAMAWHLTRPERGEDVPSEIVVSNRSQPRLDSLQEVYAQFGTAVPLHSSSARRLPTMMRSSRRCPTDRSS